VVEQAVTRDVVHANSMQVLVIDHYLPGKTMPTAKAIVNPNLRGCESPTNRWPAVGLPSI
jgi:single-stranded-DNA-specific exonuclease